MTRIRWIAEITAALILLVFFFVTDILATKWVHPPTMQTEGSDQWVLDTSFNFPVRIAFVSTLTLANQYSDRVMFVLIEDRYCSPDHYREVFVELEARHHEAPFMKIDVYSDSEMLRRAIARYKTYPDDLIFPDTPEGEELEKRIRGDLYIPKTAWARARYYKTPGEGETFFYKPDPQKIDMVEVIIKPPPPPRYAGLLQPDLILASDFGDVSKARALISSGARVNFADENGESALIHAVSRNRAEIVKLLLSKGAFVDARNRYGQTALNEALSHGFREVFNLLLENKADVNARYGPGISPLHLAAYKGDAEAVEALLSRGANPNAIDQDGNTALFDAVRRQDVRIIRALIGNGASPDITNNRGQTPRMLATQSRDQTIIELLTRK